MSPARRKPTLTIVAGPNGAGKTTLVKALQADGHMTGPHVNPDEIAARMGGEASGRELRAGREAIRQARQHIAAKESFAQETTLTGAWPLKLMTDAKAAGFTVRMIYVGVEDLAVSQARVEDRVGKGGHAVQLADQRRRFDRSIANVAAAARSADSAVMLDNSSVDRPYALVAEVDRGRIRSRAPDAPAWSRRALASLPDKPKVVGQPTAAVERLAASAARGAAALQDPARRAAAQQLAEQIGAKARGAGGARSPASPSRRDDDRER